MRCLGLLFTGSLQREKNDRERREFLRVGLSAFDAQHRFAVAHGPHFPSQACGHGRLHCSRTGLVLLEVPSGSAPKPLLAY
jgi:hypothetical protein